MAHRSQIFGNYPLRTLPGTDQVRIRLLIEVVAPSANTIAALSNGDQFARSALGSGVAITALLLN